MRKKYLKPNINIYYSQTNIMLAVSNPVIVVTEPNFTAMCNQNNLFDKSIGCSSSKYNDKEQISQCNFFKNGKGDSALMYLSRDYTTTEGQSIKSGCYYVEIQGDGLYKFEPL